MTSACYMLNTIPLIITIIPFITISTCIHQDTVQHKTTEQCLLNVQLTAKRKREQSDSHAKRESDSRARALRLYTTGRLGPTRTAAGQRCGPRRTANGGQAYEQSAHVADSKNTGVGGLHTKLKLIINGKLK